MREINVATITQNIKEMCIEANHFLSDDMKEVFQHSLETEESPLGRQILGQLMENMQEELNLFFYAIELINMTIICSKELFFN